MQELNKHVKELATEKLKSLEEYFKSDCIFYYGQIIPMADRIFREFIESLKQDNGRQNRLVILLNCPGGDVEIVEKMVEIIRYHYKEVYFVVPDEAMSAGTIFCMSGDKIYMDYSSSLGPIDPQIFNGQSWVPALGYLDQFEKMIERSKKEELTDAELIIMQNQDLAMLNLYEQAKNLTITLLKKWLVDYKFKNWEKHRTSVKKRGKPVTKKEKQQRAEEIAKMLSNNKLWHSHGRKIGLTTLSGILKLEIEDYSKNEELRTKIRSYNDFLVDYLRRYEVPLFLHSRCHF